jgi:hypothetical protein
MKSATSKKNTHKYTHTHIYRYGNHPADVDLVLVEVMDQIKTNARKDGL